MTVLRDAFELYRKQSRCRKIVYKRNDKTLNKQLSLNIKNDFDGEYVTTKLTGSGFGIKSANAILKLNGGFLKIDDTGGVFNVFATLKN